MSKIGKTSPFTKKDLLQLVIMVLFVLLVRVFVLSPVKVDGQSMMPTLVDQQRIWSLKTSQPKRFDIVNFVPPTEANKQYIKRVIGLPGDKVVYREDQLYINDQAVAEPFLADYQAKLAVGELFTEDYSLESHLGMTTIPAGKYFVLGDNRPHSFDGNEFGLIDQAAIIAVAKVSYWPPSEIGLMTK